MDPHSKHFWLPALVVALALSACDHAKSASAADAAANTLPDAAAPDPRTGPLAKLEESKLAWEALKAKQGDTYWYQEQNCPPSSTGGTATQVQVQGSVVQSALPSSLTRAQCDAPDAVSRYEDFVGKTLDALYVQCHDLLSRPFAMTDAGPDTFVLTTDAQGVLKTCSRTATQCQGACDEGFHLAGWGFGMPPAAGPAACEVGGQVYPSGTANVPDPRSCNKCSCVDGALSGCTKISCPVVCPGGTTYGTSCSSCGPTDACATVRLGCLPACGVDADCTDVTLHSCQAGVCRSLCG